MKKRIKRLVILVVVVSTAPFVLFKALSFFSFAAFFIFPKQVNTDSCVQYYTGVSKGTVWNRGEWHHYVEFEVDRSIPAQKMEVVESPLPSSVWKYSSIWGPDNKHVGYRWPSNWWDPFPASSWKICLLSS